MKWQPIIDMSKQKDFLIKLSDIADTLLTNLHHFKSNNGIISERIGSVLFLFYYAGFKQEEKYADIAFDLVSRMFDELNSNLAQGAYHNEPDGFPAVGWALGLLEKEGFIKADTNEVLEELDDFLYRLMIEDMKRKRFDYMSGAFSKALYFLNRADKPMIRFYLEKLVHIIYDVCEKDPGGGLKFTINGLDDSGNDISHCDLGLAHGMPGVTWFLSKIMEHGIAKDKTRILLAGFTSYILQQSQDTTTYLSNFPKFAAHYFSMSNSRLGWCYGDLGISIGLWQAAKISGAAAWEEMAIKILLHSTRRRDLKENEIVDACMCHGTAGAAHIYNRMYHYTGIEDFKQTALYWFQETIKMAGFTDGYAGYKSWKGETGCQWVNDANLFRGIAGIGLAILAAVSSKEPKWDRAFLLN